MNEASLQAAANLLHEHWIRGALIPALPVDIRPTTREDGYAIQARLEALSRSPIYGWKIAATSAAGQAHINVDGPIAGRILAERVVPCAGVVPAGPNHMAVAEVEFAFRMGRDLEPRPQAFSVEEVLAAVDTLHVAIEIPDSRYEDFAQVGAPQLIADNACAHYFVAAEASTADWRAIDLVTHRVVGRIEGKLEREGSGANVLDDPRIALTWLANELSNLGITLRKGQMVTTGTCVTPMPISSGDLVTADFGPLGTATVRIG
ncbi:2-keto-4-pentenoate hydratase [Noviherbaspirillum pedocola]|uniref:Hydratase n=1 Tax=Noviherbaspirillum pedocola TaxID=2801341 RepID=A0A934T302_9BURK|nr:fumarylacetoacetate hydrolase family protein [Noviherbaspirillum pedocola]MBK4738782.1 hydratase [Noviherbaspirillum pedocola]